MTPVLAVLAVGALALMSAGTHAHTHRHTVHLQTITTTIIIFYHQQLD